MKKNKERKVAMIIPTYNQIKLLEKCINSLKKTTSYKNYKIYVVDDSGEGKIGKEIKRKFKDVEVVINKKNLGCSKTMNVGVKTAKEEYNPDYFLILNDDTEVFQKDWLKNLIVLSEKDKEIGIMGCKLVYSDRRMQNAGGFLEKWKISKLSKIGKDDLLDVDHIMGAFMLIKKEVVRKIGGFDEDFSPYLLEDTDYCLRAKEKGFKIKSYGGVEVIHQAHQSLKNLKDPKLFFRFKNDIRFSWRHLSFSNFIFRVFVYLPSVALFKKVSDESSLEIKNLRIRKELLSNLGYLFKAYLFVLWKKIKSEDQIEVWCSK